MRKPVNTTVYRRLVIGLPMPTPDRRIPKCSAQACPLSGVRGKGCYVKFEVSLQCSPAFAGRPKITRLLQSLRCAPRAGHPPASVPGGGIPAARRPGRGSTGNADGDIHVASKAIAVLATRRHAPCSDVRAALMPASCRPLPDLRSGPSAASRPPRSLLRGSDPLQTT